MTDWVLKTIRYFDTRIFWQEINSPLLFQNKNPGFGYSIGSITIVDIPDLKVAWKISVTMTILGCFKDHPYLMTRHTVANV